MSPWLFLLFPALYLGLRLIQFLAVWMYLLRLPQTPLRIHASGEMPALRPDEAAAVAELEALGFQAIGWAWVDRDPLRIAVLRMRHADAPAFAELTLLAGAYGGYPLAFYSFRSEGRMLVTANRRDPMLSLVKDPEAEILDANADDPESHWQAHQARLSSEEILLPDDAEAVRRITARSEGFFDRLRQADVIVEIQGHWHLTLKSAAWAAWRTLRAQKALTRPYRSEALAGANASSYQAQTYRLLEQTQQLRRSRRDLKGWLLMLSIAAPLMAWGVLFSWGQALALVAILLVHESGHAVAMRLFGYRDMSMFFIPLLGAVVTGQPRKITAWKQILVLLAGPLPGLLAGLAALLSLSFHPLPEGGFDWGMVATMAVVVNLFNLLPLTPLDGGRMLDITLFSRWPMTRLLFVAVSVMGFAAVAYYLQSWVAGVLALLIARGMASQWRVARLQRAWRGELSDDAQIDHLFEVARTRFRPQALMQRIFLVKAVFAHRHVRSPRPWETVLVLLLMGGLWSGVAALAVGEGYFTQASSSLSPPQQAFDTAYNEYDGEFDRLDALAAALTADDPRRIDLAVLKAEAQPEPTRQRELEKILVAGKDGYHYSLAQIAENGLYDLYQTTRDAPPEQRAQRLRREADRLAQLAPGIFPGTIEARLRAAEALDEAGDGSGAKERLEQLLTRTRDADDCRCQQRKVTQALAWFHIAHEQPQAALALLDASGYAEAIHQQRDSLALDYAWALLAADRAQEGLAYMRYAVYGKAYHPTWVERLRGEHERPARLHRPLELAYALSEAGQPEAARALITPSTRWSCLRLKYSDSSDTGPWQGSRERAIRATAERICPAGASD